MRSLCLSPRIKQSFSLDKDGRRPIRSNLLIALFILEAHLAVRQVVGHRGGRELALLSLPVRGYRFSFALNDSVLAQLKTGIRHLLNAVRGQFMHSLISSRMESGHMRLRTLRAETMIRMVICRSLRPAELRFVVLCVFL